MKKPLDVWSISGRDRNLDVEAVSMRKIIDDLINKPMNKRKIFLWSVFVLVALSLVVCVITILVKVTYAVVATPIEQIRHFLFG